MAGLGLSAGITIKLYIEEKELATEGRIITVEEIEQNSDVPLTFKESLLYAKYQEKKEWIHNLPYLLKEQAYYMYEDTKSLLINIYKTITLQNRPKVLYRRVEVTKVRETIVQPVIEKKKRREEVKVDGLEEVVEQIIIVNGEKVRRKVYREEISERERRRREEQRYREELRQIREEMKERKRLERQARRKQLFRLKRKPGNDDNEE